MRRAWLLLLPFALLALGAGRPEGLDLFSLEGEALRLAPRGDAEVLVVHFWASWCPDCVRELPVLERAARACRDTPVRLVTVNVGESRESVTSFRERYGLELPLLRDPEGEVWRSVAKLGLPANLIWSAAERRAEIGPRSEAEWRERLQRLGCSPVSATAR